MTFIRDRVQAGSFVSSFLMLALVSACSTNQQSLIQKSVLEREAHQSLISGDLKGAEREDEKALAIDGNDPEILNNLAVVFDKEGRLEKALEEIKKAENLRPENSVILMNRARLDLEAGHQSQALESARKIQAKEKWPDGFRTLMGKIDLDLGRYNQAHLYLHEAFERHPDNPLILTYLGIVHFRIGNLVQSQKDFQKALAMNPSKALKRVLLPLLRNPGSVLDRDKKIVPGLSGRGGGKKKGES